MIDVKRMSPRAGKVLRYVVSTRTQPVVPLKLVVQIAWSDLPHSEEEARKTLDLLKLHRLVKKVGKDQYEPTDAGRAAIAEADKAGLWRQPPPPAVTNKFLHTEKPVKQQRGKQKT